MDGHTAVIGGIFTRNTGRNLDQVPFFGDIPPARDLVPAPSRECDTRGELVIFLTPQDRESGGGARALSEPEGAALRAREGAVEIFGLAASWGAGPPAPRPQIACACPVSSRGLASFADRDLILPKSADLDVFPGMRLNCLARAPARGRARRCARGRGARGAARAGGAR